MKSYHPDWFKCINEDWTLTKLVKDAYSDEQDTVDFYDDLSKLCHQGWVSLSNFSELEQETNTICQIPYYDAIVPAVAVIVFTIEMMLKSISFETGNTLEIPEPLRNDITSFKSTMKQLD